MPQQKKQQTTYVPVTFMVPANLLGSSNVADVTCQVGQARFKAVQVPRQQQQQKQQKQQRSASPSKASKKQSSEPLRPHHFGGRTPSQLLAVAANSAKRHQRPVYDTTTDDGKLTPSQLALNQIPKQYQTTFTTTERGRLTPSQLPVASNSQKRQATLRPSLFAGPTGSQLFVKTERLRLKARNQRALENLVYLTGVAELLAPTVYSKRSTARKSQQQQQQQQQRTNVPSLPGKLEPTPSLLLLKYLSQVPPAAVSVKKTQRPSSQQASSPSKKWAQKKAVSKDNLFLEPFLAAFKL
jgi:hypothetical protein